MISQLGWGQEQLGGQLGSDQYSVPIRLTNSTVVKGKNKNIPQWYLASYLPKVGELFITYLSQRQCELFSYTRNIIHLSGYLLFLFQLYLQPEWHYLLNSQLAMNDLNGRSASIHIPAIVRYCVCQLSPGKDISSGYVPAFQSLLTQQISSWFSSMVFDGIPSHFMPLQ